MINAGELRVGNYIEDIWSPNKPFRIIKFDNKKAWYSKATPPFNTWLKNIEPVKLTEEILLKAGFKKLGEDEDDIFFKLYIGYHFGCDIFISGNIENGIFNCYSNDKLKYLHQLQNLYFALTSKELNIELNQINNL